MTSSGFKPSVRSAYDDGTSDDPANIIKADPTRLMPPDVSSQQLAHRSNGSISKEGRRRLRRGGSKRHKGPWKKLLWVKQSFPDNYTDEATFLDHMQRNPQFQQYEFWTLVASSTVIVQHVCSVVIFVCCFAGIAQNRLSSVVVASTGSSATILGWALWDYWVRQDEKAELESNDNNSTGEHMSSQRVPEDDVVDEDVNQNKQPSFALSDRNRRRLATGKSAILIYCTLLGLSPILKSLTESTTEDSIWAISAWLLIINVFFFDYSSVSSANAYTASLSTNAAIMASTVLASRLTSTTHVFSLMLFSIETFGLFPIFRRYLGHLAWNAHVVLTVLLVLAAWSGLAVIVTGGGWTTALVGAVLGSIAMGILMATCAVWLIGMQKYKNEIYGPWDPARPVIRRRWD